MTLQVVQKDTKRHKKSALVARGARILNGSIKIGLLPVPSA